MSFEIEKNFAENDPLSAVATCLKENKIYLALVLGIIHNDKSMQYYQTMKKVYDELSNEIAEEGLRAVQNIPTENLSDNVTPLTSQGAPQDVFASPPPSSPATTTQQPPTQFVPRKREKDGKILIKLLCHWMPSREITEIWNKMSKGNYTWNNIQLVTDDSTPDYFVILNTPYSGETFNPKRSIVFQMEPLMAQYPQKWQYFADPRSPPFAYTCKHVDEYNNNEWHLSKTYSELLEFSPKKDENLNNVISTVLSKKYFDLGQVKRVDFVKFLEKKGQPIHVYGSDEWKYKDYKGSLPLYCKDDGLFPYKYTFNVENHSIKNYYTEKLIDGILSECLVFYSGCYNISEYIDERAFVYLELSNFEDDYQTIQRAIKEDWWSQRLPYIRAAKKKILNELQFFPRLERIINKLEEKQD